MHVALTDYNYLKGMMESQESKRLSREFLIFIIKGLIERYGTGNLSNKH